MRLSVRHLLALCVAVAVVLAVRPFGMFVMLATSSIVGSFYVLVATRPRSKYRVLCYSIGGGFFAISISFCVAIAFSFFNSDPTNEEYISFVPAVLIGVASYSLLSLLEGFVVGGLWITALGIGNSLKED